MDTEKHKILIGYAKSLSWPLVIVFVCLAFYSPIANLINRIRAITIAGISADASTGPATDNGERPSSPAPDISFHALVY